VGVGERKKTKLYKVTSADGSACHGGSGKWTLPRGGHPGKWMPSIADPSLCRHGYHLVTAEQLLKWLDKPNLVVWEAEGRGPSEHSGDKSAHGEARLLRKVGRWTDKTARLLAADCAKHVLAIFEKERPSDDRPRKAIAAARAFAFGKIGAAARAAARDAARAAAWAAAWAAARAAAWAAARDAERKYQTRRLFYWLRKSGK